MARLVVKVLVKQISLICFRAYLEVYVAKNPTCFSRWSFRLDGELHNLYKYKVNDDLTIQITKHKNSKNNKLVFEFWNDTVQKMLNERIRVE